ncbi:MAG: DUF1592 domain-containing protein [Verrucomicrobiae bacterium]|nr:DUF1592 domain-containing protein [Verrucomicrobiae bacterium]
MTLGAVLGTLLSLAIPVVVVADQAETYTREIRPILERRCFDCHGPDKATADLNLAVFEDYPSVIALPEVWQHVFERVQAFEMPPKRSGELPFHEHQKLMGWLRRLPRPEEFDCDQIASDRTANFYRGYVMSRRLNRDEYLNTLRDLLGIEVPVGHLLPADGGGGEGFDTTGNALFLSPIHIERYLQAAEVALATLLPDSPAPGASPVVASPGVASQIDEARQALLAPHPGLELLPARAAAREIVSSFARRAFRRPVNPGEVDRLLTLFDRVWSRGEGYLPAVRLALQGVLISPHFLFLAEPEPPGGGVHPLDAVPLASKLSYFLWSSMPDERLLSLAESGALLETNAYRAEIHRMLADPRSRALGERFALQWLDVDRLGHEIRPDPTRYPEFTDALAASMRGEVVAFVHHLFRENRSLLELIDSDYTLADERLARLYGLSGVAGEEMRPVALEGRERGGILGMAAIHALTSYPLRTSPVLRGRWVLESLLGDRVPPPPPDVPALDEPDEAGTTEAVSIRQQLEVHRVKAECAACHDKMDPLGFGLENFDVLGRWRETDRGLPVDARGTLPSGEEYDGPAGLREVLMARKDAILRHLARKLTGFAYGRDLNRFDQCVVDRAMDALAANEYRAATLVEAIAFSYPFRNRFYPKETP